MDLREAVRQRNLGYENRQAGAQLLFDALTSGNWHWTDQRAPTMQLCHAHVKQSLSGPLYHSTESIEAMIGAASETLPQTTIAQELLPTPAGVWIFTAPRFKTSRISGMDGLSWYTAEGAVYISPLQVFSASDGYLPGLLPVGSTLWEFGEDIDSSLERTRRQIIEPGNTGFARAVLSWFLSALLFLKQRLLETTTHIPDRAMRKWARRLSLPESSGVRVVQLRRKSPDHHGPSEHPDWSCHWVVTGHWRAQYHPSTKTHEPRWILPHLKGDFDKPFKPPTETVFAVNR